MSHFLIVGPATTALRTYLKEHGHTYLRLIDLTQTKFPNKKISGRTVADFSNLTDLFNLTNSLHQKQTFNGVLTTYENSVLPTAQIAKNLKLAALPSEAAEACTDKFLMRQMFSRAPIAISPEFQIIQNEDDVRNFASKHSFPLIIKPANLAKSLLVTKSSSLEELIANYKRTVEHLIPTYTRYAPHRSPKLIIEEFMEGSIHSIDAFADVEGNIHLVDSVVDYQTGYDIGFDDNFHYSRILPSALSILSKDELKKVAVHGCRALGMKNTPAHIEIIMTPRGPRIVEIGARYGGYRERMHKIANGVDILGASIAISLGQIPEIEVMRDDPCAVLELFPKTPGTFTGISNYEKVLALPSCIQFIVKVKAGQKVGKASDGYKMCAIVLLHNSNLEQFNKDLRFINEFVRIQTN